MTEAGQTYYATEAITAIESLFIQYRAIYGAENKTVYYLKDALGRLKNSVKFRLPDNGYILPDMREKAIRTNISFGSFIENYLKEFRLPYPQTLIEYKFEPEKLIDKNNSDFTFHNKTPYTAVILLAKESKASSVSLIPLWKTLINGVEDWTMGNFMAYFDTESKTINLLPITDIGEQYGKDSHAAQIDLRGEVCCLIEFLVALQCSNCDPITQAHNRDNLNKKRKKRGKPPFFSYKVLTIFQSGAIESKCGGSGRSPRVHLRRGHIRRLPDKTVWVNASVVGDKLKGLVSKDYVMARGEE